MKKVRCIIIDDEPIARDIIKSYIDKLDNLEIVKTCQQALEAFEFLKLHPVDLIFLDIQMPKMTGINFLKILKDPPKVIIVSAYREYALQGFELDVVDYLLKPVSFERFLKAIDKYYSHHQVRYQEPPGNPLETDSGETLWVRADRKNVKIEIDRILYIEGLKDYLKIHLDDQLIISKMTMKEMEGRLDKNLFIRIHRSYLVAVNKITAYTQDNIEVGKNTLPIGYSYRNGVLEFLGGK